MPGIIQSIMANFQGVIPVESVPGLLAINANFHLEPELQEKLLKHHSRYSVIFCY
jgi:hypothetical protein